VIDSLLLGNFKRRSERSESKGPAQQAPRPDRKTAGARDPKADLALDRKGEWLGGRKADLVPGRKGEWPGGQKADLVPGHKGEWPGGQKADLVPGHKGEWPGGRKAELVPGCIGGPGGTRVREIGPGRVVLAAGGKEALPNGLEVVRAGVPSGPAGALRGRMDLGPKNQRLLGTVKWSLPLMDRPGVD
jgi:hypothetical protein